MKNCFIKLNESNQDYYVFGDPESKNVVDIEVNKSLQYIILI